MYLGVEESTGLVYEGNGGLMFSVVPPPALTQVKLIERETDWSSLPGGLVASPFAWVFREVSFDPATRIRRGTLYQPHGAQPCAQQVFEVYPPIKQLYTYNACTALLNRPRRGEGDVLALGTQQAASAWLIVQTEVLTSGAVLVTLKAMSAFGVLPALDEAKLPGESVKIIKQSYERVLDSANRESPSSVVEHCRDALQVFISRWLVAQGADERCKKKELAPLAKDVESEPYELFCVGNLAKVVARLHGGRGKSNERLDNGARDLVAEDAELALSAVGFTLRDFDWAKA